MASRRLRRFASILTLGLIAACSDNKPPAAPGGAAVASVDTLQVVELTPGGGAAIAAGQKAVVQYTGWLYETSAADKKGKEFDSSRNAGRPFSFVVGAGQVIKGWDQGVLGMKVGGRRRLTIPAALAYGDVGAGDLIPPGATLIFDVDLAAIE